MIDPKVVELSVYNGIPHLMIPVVTDPEESGGRFLNWAVAEMMRRYQAFAEQNVRDMKGYNEKAASSPSIDGEELKIMPQIVIIVDELADLMMVAPGNVKKQSVDWHSLQERQNSSCSCNSASIGQCHHRTN